MNDATNDTRKASRELLDATRPFARESILHSSWALFSTLVPLALVLYVAARGDWWLIRLVAAIIAGLLMVRLFILYHDFAHGALFRDSRLAGGFFFIFGLIALTPLRYWRYSHNFHHANVGKPIAAHPDEFSLLTSDVGSFPIMTTTMWHRANALQRLHYRISRHPLTITCAYVMVFLLSLCIVPFVHAPRKNWQGLVAVLVHVSVVGTVWWQAGFTTVLFTLLIPFALASAIGAYFFFAQHNYAELKIVPRAQWSHYRGALESSSYLKLGPIMRWFTANIGYHHVHHLNSQIPYYRLPSAMAAIPALQHVGTTTLWPRDVLACLRLNLWDEETQKLVPFSAVAGR